MRNGILWRVRTGAPWRDVPERYGPWSTLASRLRRWRRAGVWDWVFAAVQARADVEGRLDWEVQFVDGSVIRAHQHAAGGKGGRSSKRSGAVGAATRPKSTCGRRQAADSGPDARGGVGRGIPHKANEHRTGPFERAVYRRRNVVERLIARCKQFRGLATRYEKLADTYRTLWVIVMTILWL